MKIDEFSILKLENGEIVKAKATTPSGSQTG